MTKSRSTKSSRIMGKLSAEDAGAGGGTLESVFRGCGGNEKRAALDSGFERSPTAFECGDFEGAFFRTPQQEDTYYQAHDVGEPHSEGGRDFSLPREGDADQRNQVVGKDQDDGEDESGRLAAFLGRQAEGKSDQGEHDARRGQSEAAVEFDPVPARGGGVLAGSR